MIFLLNYLKLNDMKKIKIFIELAFLKIKNVICKISPKLSFFIVLILIFVPMYFGLFICVTFNIFLGGLISTIGYGSALWFVLIRYNRNIKD
jgi:hypothetical protein